MAKHDLVIVPPLMNAAGSAGFSPDLHSPVDWHRLGAFVTNPVSLEPRTPAHGKRFEAFPGGFLLHTGYPNPGLRRVLHQYSRQWTHSPLLVIVHLLAKNAGDVARMVRDLEQVEGIMGVEIGISSDANPDHVVALTHAAFGELAVVVRLPMERAVELSPAAVDGGATAVSLAPPRGSIFSEDGRTLQGRLYGPSVFPVALRVVQELVERGLPVIGAGGVYTHEHMESMLKVGALAVQVDSALWRGAGSGIFL